MVLTKARSILGPASSDFLKINNNKDPHWSWKKPLMLTVAERSQIS